MPRGGRGLPFRLHPNRTRVNTFSKGDRLLKRAEFLRLSEIGQKLHVPHFLLLYSAAETAFPRIGITVSRKIGKAIIRNRIKRIVRDYFRLRKRSFPPSDFNIIAKRGAGELSFSEIQAELDKAFARIKTR